MDTSAETFHANCIMKWSGHNCPVCYYIQNPEQMKDVACMKCDGTKSVWMCLTCGHLGCGRTEGKHALDHYLDTKHDCVMDVNNFKVWDYNLAKYVHKLEDTNKNNDNSITYEETMCSCLVCRHKQTPKLAKKSKCMKCEDDKIGSLWICLFCRHVGCGRHRFGHAFEHYKKTKHPLCMQLDTFAIWDYSEMKYVHRLLHENMEKFEILGQTTDFTQKEDIDKRMDRLEKEWNEFSTLSETNEKMIAIEQRLLMLDNDKKVLQERLHEHDAKLNDLITQVIGNRTKNNFNSNKIKPKNLIHEETRPDTTVTLESYSGFIALVIFILFLCNFLTLFFKNITGYLCK